MPTNKTSNKTPKKTSRQNHNKTAVSILWHMHQPDYRDAETGEYILPWTYLHAIKDYEDMAAHIDNCEHAKAVVNFAPILLEQLHDYAEQVEAHLNKGAVINDPFLDCLTAEHLPDARSPNFKHLVEQFLRSHPERIIARFEPYNNLVERYRSVESDEQALGYLGQQFLVDLCVWYHLGWMAETVRRTDSRIKNLEAKRYHFTMSDRMCLMEVISEILSGLLPKYKRLADEGKIELIMSPYAHPIVPLLIDIESHKEASPSAPLPKHKNYAGGVERAKWHIEKGIQVFERFFKRRPHGAWPSEGAISEDALTLFTEAGFEWIATGDSVLHNSLRNGNNASLKQAIDESKTSIHRAYTLAPSTLKASVKKLVVEYQADLKNVNAKSDTDHSTACFFRDDGLSDVIGFEYSTWHADHAVADLVKRLEERACEVKDTDNNIISIIMDGENAWEYFPFNAYYFLEQLYRKISESEIVELTTYHKFLSRDPQPSSLERLVAGSWVHGTFSTWIGEQDKNKGWDLLCEAKLAVDEFFKQNPKVSKAKRQEIIDVLAICEGSDWFWWFGDYNPAQSVEDFERLFRYHLKKLYKTIDRPAPAALAEVLSVGGGDPDAGGVMRHGHEDESTVD